MTEKNTDLLCNLGIKLDATLYLAGRMYVVETKEFFIDLLALGPFGLVDVCFREHSCENDSEISFLKNKYKEGTVWVMRSGTPLFISQDSVELLDPKLEPLKDESLCQVFSAQITEELEASRANKFSKMKMNDDSALLCGYIIGWQGVFSKYSNSMGIVQVDSVHGRVEAVLVPRVYRHYFNMLSIKEKMQFHGNFLPNDACLYSKFIVDSMAPYGRS